MDTETHTNAERKASRAKAATAWREGGLSVPLPNIGNVVVASFWFVPMVLVVVAVVTALGLVKLEEYLGTQVVGRWPFLLNAGPQAAGRLLSAIATSVATIAATTFSLTIVAITLAAQQYTPRMLHNYISNRGNQVALGMLAGTFAYALLVLGSIRSNPGFVPVLALTGALVLVLASVGVFIYFIHHVASILQGTKITADVEQRTLRTIARAFLSEAGEAADTGARRARRCPRREAAGMSRWSRSTSSCS